ncbi:hypothetical protein T12_11456 [Trichinella patagoniensis]|uniref:Uncharacterized protein n=1 Tax=Trichinella patagoniensis TaxID=990121 RepID=A0A0V0ZV44_9BILA|nr:hypothetical protein T12_11456 [Trichinella patagoniensis]
MNTMYSKAECLAFYTATIGKLISNIINYANIANEMLPMFSSIFTAMCQDYMKASGYNKLKGAIDVDDCTFTSFIVIHASDILTFVMKIKKEEITQNIPITDMNQQRRGTIATVRSLEKRQSINSSRRCSSSIAHL